MSEVWHDAAGGYVCTCVVVLTAARGVARQSTRGSIGGRGECQTLWAAAIKDLFDLINQYIKLNLMLFRYLHISKSIAKLNACIGCLVPSCYRTKCPQTPFRWQCRCTACAAVHDCMFRCPWYWSLMSGGGRRTTRLTGGARFRGVTGACSAWRGAYVVPDAVWHDKEWELVRPE